MPITLAHFLITFGRKTGEFYVAPDGQCVVITGNGLKSKKDEFTWLQTAKELNLVGAARHKEEILVLTLHIKKCFGLVFHDRRQNGRIYVAPV